MDRLLNVAWHLSGIDFVNLPTNLLTEEAAMYEGMVRDGGWIFDLCYLLPVGLPFYRTSLLRQFFSSDFESRKSTYRTRLGNHSRWKKHNKENGVFQATRPSGPSPSSFPLSSSTAIVYSTSPVLCRSPSHTRESSGGRRLRVSLEFEEKELGSFSDSKLNCDRESLKTAHESRP